MDKCFISIDHDQRIQMHDLIQDMGREILRQESPQEPGKRSRLWFHEDIIHVLENDTGTDKVLIMILEYMPEALKVNWNGKAFKKMKNLKILILDEVCFSKAPKYLPNSLRVLQWQGYPGSCLPTNFNPKKLDVLNLQNSYIQSLGPVMRLNNLSVLNLSDCKFVTKVPDISGIPNLTEFIVNSCKNLIEIHDSVGFLKRLLTLSAFSCCNLRAFPQSINLPSLINLKLSGCSSLKKFPEILGEMKFVKRLDLGQTNLEVPFSIRNLVALQEISGEGFAMLPELNDASVEGCEVIPSLVSSVTTIILPNCNILDEFLPICLCWFGNVKFLDLSGNNFTVLSECINKFHLLERLYLDDCKHLREIKGIPPHIKEVWARNCTLLNSESRNILMRSKELHDKDVIQEVCFPGSTIPEWFHHRSRSPFISFWYQNKFPLTSLCFVVPAFDLDVVALRVDLIIDSGNIMFSKKIDLATYHFYHTLDEDHILFISEQRYVEDNDSVCQENGWDKIPLVSEWSHVEIFISVVKFCVGETQRILAKEVGLCLKDKEEIREEDIRFNNPYKRTKLSHHSDSNSNLGLRLMTDNNFRDKDIKSQEATLLAHDQFISNKELKFEIAKVSYKGRLVDCEGAQRFVQLMQRLNGDYVYDLSGRTMLLKVIRNTQVSYYSVLIKGLPLLNKWLQDVLNANFDDTETDESISSFLYNSLKVLKMPPLRYNDLFGQLRSQIYQKLDQLLPNWASEEAEEYANYSSDEDIVIVV